MLTVLPVLVASLGTVAILGSLLALIAATAGAEMVFDDAEREGDLLRYARYALGVSVLPLVVAVVGIAVLHVGDVSAISHALFESFQGRGDGSLGFGLWATVAAGSSSICAWLAAHRRATQGAPELG